MSRDIRTRSFCFTLNNYSEEEFDEICGWSCRYLVVGREVGDGGTPHLQGYVEFENQVSLRRLKKLNKRIHWETRRGTPSQAANYCKKEHNYAEFGLLSKQGERTDIAEVVELVVGGCDVDQVIMEHPRTSLHCQRGLRELAALRQSHRSEKPICTWLFGESGAGKTRWVFDNHAAEDVWIKSTRWWADYKQQEVILLDDFRPVFGHDYADFLRLCDRYPYIGEIKGGHVKINSPFLYVTAPCPPWEWYEDNQLTEILRRFENVIEVVRHTDDEVHYIAHKEM